MRIAVCDDERNTAEHLKAIIENNAVSLDTVTDVFTQGEELLHSFSQKNYDIVFLDIEMPSMDGLTAAGKLREMSGEVFIVFLTSHVEYAIKGYEVNALRYLTKPAEKSAVLEIINHVHRKMSDEKTLWVKTSDGEYKLKLTDIIFIEAFNQKMKIHTLNGDYEVWGKLNEYEDKLCGEGFFRIHRSYLVSLSKVTGIMGRYIRVAGGEELPVGRTKENSFRTAMVAYADKEAF